METRLSHLVILRNEFERRVTRNKSYSLRAYARDLGFSPAALSSVLNLKKGLSEKKASEITARLGLSKKEKEFFVLSVISQHSRSSLKRKNALEKVKQERLRQARISKIESGDFASLQSWYSLALLEMMELPSCTHKLEWFAKKLALNSIIVKGALERLAKAGLVSFKNGKYRPLTTESVTEVDVPSQAIKKFHAELLKKAEAALFFDPVLEREFLNMTVAFPSTEIEEAKQVIREFQEAFAQRFYHDTLHKKDSVYQLSLQFFRIDKKEGK